MVTLEDAAEELVGEITDEHDPAGADPGPTRGPDGWLVAGAMHLDEAERLLGHDLPRGDYATVGGLVIAGLTRLPAVDDRVELTLPAPPDGAAPAPVLTAIVRAVQRRVPKRVELRLATPDVEEVER